MARGSRQRQSYMHGWCIHGRMCRAGGWGQEKSMVENTVVHDCVAGLGHGCEGMGVALKRQSVKLDGTYGRARVGGGMRVGPMGWEQGAT